MKERIKEIREKLGLTKTAFGKSILITQSSITTIENGKSNPSQQTIALICDRFSVNENWLRTGEGEMFTEKHNERHILIVEMFEKLKPSQQEYIMHLIEKLPEKEHLFI